LFILHSLRIEKVHCATLKLYLKHDYSIVFLRDKFISFSPNQPTCRLLFYKPPYLSAWCVLCCILVYLRWLGFIICACIAQNLSI